MVDENALLEHSDPSSLSKSAVDILLNLSADDDDDDDAAADEEENVVEFSTMAGIDAVTVAEACRFRCSIKASSNALEVERDFDLLFLIFASIL